MDEKMRYWKNKWNIPNTKWSISGYSRAAFRTGFYVPELDIMFDAGPQNFNKPKKIFITHGHGDHICELPLSIKTDRCMGTDYTTIYGPKEIKGRINKYVGSLYELNDNEDYDASTWYEYKSMEAKMIFDLEINNNPYRMEIFSCEHSVPTVSYGLSIIKNKLKNEYHGMSGKEIAALKLSGVNVTNQIVEPTLAYVCDTSINVFKDNPSLLSYKTIIIECTFLKDEHNMRAEETLHISWNDLKPFIINNKQNNFMLMHFSMQYRDNEIIDFFDKELKDIDNVIIMA